MLIRREAIDENGLFDPVFGRGYGEEVDFCQRIKHNGWESAISNWSYVFHLEARSFSMEEKQKILEQNNQIIRKRYPRYQGQVKEYIEKAIKYEAKTIGINNYAVFPSRIKQSIKKLLSKTRSN